MNIQKKERLEQLKKENRDKQYKKETENNVLLSECLEAFGANGEVLDQRKKEAVYQVFCEKIPFLPWRIEWEQFKIYHEIDTVEEILEKCKCKDFYIIWCHELPIIKSSIAAIVSNIEDVCAVEFDTWLFSIDYNEIIEFYHEGAITFGEINNEKRNS